MLRRWLGRYVDFDTGTRRRGKQKRFKKPANLSRFREEGRALLNGGDLVRLTFDAGSEAAKLAIGRLVASTEMDFSEFFAALIKRRCHELKEASSKGSRHREEAPIGDESPTHAGEA